MVKHQAKPAIEVPESANYLILRELYYLGENRQPDRSIWLVIEPGKPERVSRSKKFHEMDRHLTQALGFTRQTIYDQDNRVWYKQDGKLPLITTYRYSW